MIKFLIYFMMISLPAITLADDISVRVSGESKIQNADTIKARSEAFNEAILKAVREGVGRFLPEQPFSKSQDVLNEKVFSKAAGYLDTIAIVGISCKGGDPGTVKVEIMAAVAKDKLENDLSKLGLLAFRDSLPLVMVIVQEKNIEQVHWHFQLRKMDTAEEVIRNTLELKGFRFVNEADVLAKLDSRIEKAFYAEDMPEVSKFASEFKTNVVIIGKSLSRPVVVIENAGDSASAVAMVTLKAFKVATGDEMATSSTSATERGLDQTLAGTQAIKRAAREAIINMMPDIIGKWAEKQTQNTAVTMYVSGLKSIEDFIAFKNVFLANISGVESLERRTITGNAAAYDMTIATDVKSIVAQLQDKGLKDFVLEIRSYSDNSLDLRVKLKE